MNDVKTEKIVMCKSSKQMNTLFEGIKPNTTIIGLKMLAELQDTGFTDLKKELIDSNNILEKKLIDSNNSLEKKLTESHNALKQQLDELLTVLKDNKINTDKILLENKEDTNARFNKLQKESTDRCENHKKELKKKFDSIDETTEDVKYFKKHPKLLLIIIFGIAFIIGLALGGSKLLEIFKIIK